MSASDWESDSRWSLRRHLFGFERPETEGDQRHVRLLEAFVAGFTVYVAWTWGLFTLRIAEVVLPLGLARLVDLSFMYGGPLPVVNAALITTFTAIGFARVWRFGYAVALGLLLVQYAARFALGEIPHSANAVGTVLVGFALAPLLFRSPSEQRRFAFGFAVFFVGLGYTLAAASKLVATGPVWADGRHLWLWTYEKGIDTLSKTGTPGFNAVQQLALDHYAVATAQLVFGMVAEATAFLMWWRPFRWPVGLALIGLHVGIYLSMGIFFRAATVLLILVCLPWPLLLNRIATRRTSSSV